MYYRLYVMIDIFSRCAVHFEVHATELGELAKDFMTEAVRLNGGTAPLAIHADRGTSMTSKPVPALLSDLAILKSHSRPKVSNDNPYSEAQFKTLKWVRLSERWLISGCFGHAARLSRSMVSWS